MFYVSLYISLLIPKRVRQVTNGAEESWAERFGRTLLNRDNYLSFVLGCRNDMEGFQEFLNDCMLTPCNVLCMCVLGGWGLAAGG